MILHFAIHAGSPLLNLLTQRRKGAKKKINLDLKIFRVFATLREAKGFRSL
jgi:hypothetical protein